MVATKKYVTKMTQKVRVQNDHQKVRVQNDHQKVRDH